MIRPLLRDQMLLNDIQGASSPRHFFLWWLGQSGFLLKWGDAYALLDPYLSDSLTQKYAGTAKEHIRLTELCVVPDALDFVTVATSSHGHTDHLDAATLRPLADRFLETRQTLKLVLPTATLSAARERVGEPGIEFLPVDVGGSVRVGPFTFSAVPAAHPTVERDASGHHLFLGYLIQFGPWSVYHSGDTMWYDALIGHLRPRAVDVALFPINGNDPARGVAGNLDGREAATLAREINARLVIPQHFEMFGFNTASPDEFVQTCEQLGQPYTVLRCGERWSSASLAPVPASRDDATTLATV